MTSGPAEGEAVPSGRLDDRVLVALEGLNGRIAFSGLRRSLGAHPESLSRALRRLEREGLVERTEAGYRSTRRPETPATAEAPLRSVARIEIPPGIGSDAVLSRLTGRWFGSLRWMGVVERPHEHLLAWARRDGAGTVLLGVHGGAVRIYTTGEAGLSDENEAEDAAYELLVAVAEVLRPTTRHAAVTLFSATPAGSRRIVSGRPAFDAAARSNN